MSVLFIALIIATFAISISAFLNNIPTKTSSPSISSNIAKSSELQSRNIPLSFGQRLINSRKKPLYDLLGLGPAEIAITLVIALVLFGPETLKSLSKDVGRAAAELKEIPKTFKEGMEEGAQSSQVAKMKQLAAEKRKKRDEKKGANKDDDDDEEDDEEEEEEKA